MRGVTRPVQFTADSPPIPLDLISGRDAGEVVFIAGAGVSREAGLPDFKDLTRRVFIELAGDPENPDATVSTTEAKAYANGEYDQALWLLEERVDAGSRAPRRVRDAVAAELKPTGDNLERHRSLLALSRDPHGTPRLVTTNFDTLFERAWADVCGAAIPLHSRSGPDLPGPATPGFTGVLHIHGRVDDRENLALEASELVLTAADFGDAYLRSGWAARFLYDLVPTFTT